MNVTLSCFITVYDWSLVDLALEGTKIKHKMSPSWRDPKPKAN